MPVEPLTELSVNELSIDELSVDGLSPHHIRLDFEGLPGVANTLAYYEHL